ncbi:MAG: hypothetical protein ACLQLH_05745 [Terracidiphilus sp.]
MAEDWHQTISWERNDEWPFRWVPRLVEKLREQNLRPIDTSHLWILSDYSGMQRSSRFFSIGVLIADAGGLKNWELKRVAVRRQFLNDGRRMSFKNLNDGNRRAALVPFLDAADEIRGLSIVFAIDKRIEHFGGFDGFHKGLKERSIILGNWKSSSFERMITVTHIISVLLGMVTREGQNVTWISDADDSFATDMHKQDCARMMGRLSSLYVRHNLGSLSIGTTELDEGDRYEEDLAAIPDIAAGGVGELFNRILMEFGKVPGIAFLGPKNLSNKSELITSWFFYPNNWHQKIACSVQQISKGHYRIGVLGEPNDDPLSTSLLRPL